MKKGITIVFIANMINMVISVFNSFFLPKYLSIETYGYYKVFQLYVGYLGIAHLGFVDGIYLKYGGINIKEINGKEVLKSSCTLRNMQFILSLMIVVVSAVLKDPIVLFLALTCIPINMIAFYKNFFLATGEFEKYGTTISLIPLITFISNIFFMFVLKTDNYILYMAAYLFANVLIYLWLEFKSIKVFGDYKIFSFDFHILKSNIAAGISLTLGNFVSVLITSIDRWCIQMWMSISEFSFYSFAVSLENLFNVCVSAVTATMYNYLCKTQDDKKIIKLKSYCIIMGVYLVAVAFPAKFIIKLWIPKYIGSLACMFILICAHSFYFVIKAVYVNLYKAKGQQKHYFYQMIQILIIAAISNTVFYFLVSKTIEAIAFASLCTAVVWYFMCYYELRSIRGNIKETITLVVCAVYYLICGIYVENPILGCCVYLFGITIIVVSLCKNEFLEIVDFGKDQIYSIINKLKKK